MSAPRETEPMTANVTPAESAAALGTAALVRRFFAYYRPHRRLFALDFSCAVLSGVLELGFPMAVGLFVDELLPG